MELQQETLMPDWTPMSHKKMTGTRGFSYQKAAFGSWATSPQDPFESEVALNTVAYYLATTRGTVL